MSSVEILTPRDEARWRALVEAMPARNLAHYPRFSRVYEDWGWGGAECFVFERGGRRVLYPYIRRSLGDVPCLGESFRDRYDIVSPYCYGGFIHDAPEDEAVSLLTAFREAFAAHARELGIVAEFIRFHPMLQNHRHAVGLLDDVRLHQDNVVMDLRLRPEELFAGYRASYKQCIQHAESRNLRLVFHDTDFDVGAFAELYRGTMERHQQNGFLNFPLRYFQCLFSNIGDDILPFSVINGDCVAATSLFIRYDDTLDYFLSASDADSFHLHPNHFLLHHVACWGRERGYHLLHLGGGRPSLIFFKRGFSRQGMPYHTGRHIHDRDTYSAAVRFHERSRDPARRGSDFFPAYREGFE